MAGESRENSLENSRLSGDGVTVGGGEVAGGGEAVGLAAGLAAALAACGACRGGQLFVFCKETCE